MSQPFNIDRTLVAAYPDVFIAFAPGRDIDEAFDAAVTVEGFEIGRSGIIPSIAEINPTAPREVRDGALHPWAALAELVGLAPYLVPGQLIAQAVTPVGDWKMRKARTVIEGTTHRFPDIPGLLLPFDAALREEVAASSGLDDGSVLVGAELASVPRRRFKVVTSPVKGQRVAGFAIFSGNQLLETHASASLARKAAVQMAKDNDGELSLTLRPWIGRNEDEPFLKVDRALIAQKAVLKALWATPKREARTGGWIFIGRRD